jgi:bifunctional DNA-binding transcriptional regulator/antitoxin component of YhaV-PrlF toxin-antitoxin module
MEGVEKRRCGVSTISSKNQIMIPAEALRSAGLEAGDRGVAHADRAGRVILEREHDVVAEFAGALIGTYRPTRWTTFVPNGTDPLRRRCCEIIGFLDGDDAHHGASSAVMSHSLGRGDRLVIAASAFA